MRIHKATVEKKGAEKPYERTPRGARTRRDPPPKHNFRVELKELIAIHDIAVRLKVSAKTDRKMGPNKNSCLALAHQLDELVKSSFLKDYLQEEPNDQTLVATHQGHEVPIHGEVSTISGGFLRGGCTTPHRKKYTQGVTTVEIPQADLVPDVDLVFTKADLRGVIPHNNDPEVISLVLVDQGSSTDVMFLTTFNRLRLSTDQLKPYTRRLYGFAANEVEVHGYIELSTTFTDNISSRTSSIRYLVVDAPLAYHILLGRPTLNRLGGSSLHETHESEIALPRGSSSHHRIRPKGG